MLLISSAKKVNTTSQSIKVLDVEELEERKGSVPTKLSLLDLENVLIV